MNPIQEFLESTTPEDMKRNRLAIEHVYGNWCVDDFHEELHQSDLWSEPLQRLALSRLVADRQKELKAIEDQMSQFDQLDLDTLLSGGLDEFDDSPMLYNLMLMSIVENMGGDLRQVLDPILDLFHQSDTTLNHIGAKLLRRVPAELHEIKPNLFRVMRERGADHGPYIPGKILNRYIADDAPLREELLIALQGDDEKLIEAVLTTLAQRKVVPNDFRDILLQRVATVGYPKRSLAWYAASRLAFDPAFLSPLAASLTDTEWYVRGAATSYLKRHTPDPDRYLPILDQMLDDDEEGHDWTAAEAAVEAIRKYGPAAAHLVDRLKQKRKDWLKDGLTWEAKRIKKAIKAIRS